MFVFRAYSNVDGKDAGLDREQITASAGISQGFINLPRLFFESTPSSASPDRARIVFYCGPLHYEVRPRKDHRGVDLISDALPFGRLWYGKPDAVGNAIGDLTIASTRNTSLI